MGYSVVIGSTTINANMNFQLSMRKNVTDADKVDTIDVSIDVEGDVISTGTASSVIDAAKALSDLVSATVTPVTVQIKLDSTTKYEFLPSIAVQGPHVMSYETVPADGNGTSRQRYRISIYVRLYGNQFQKLTELDTSITEVDFEGKIIRKVWKATAKAGNLATALQYVKAFKPKGKRIRGEVERFFQQNRATGVWVWEAGRDDKVFKVDEDIEITGGGTSYSEGLQAGEDVDPVLHKNRKRALRVTVKGKIFGFDDGVRAPAPHYSTGDDIVRMENESSFSEPKLVDKDLSIWAVSYTEVYLMAKSDPPSPNHRDHKGLKLDLPPGDGTIGST